MSEKLTDCVGREIKPGCEVLYPVRRGSEMWLNKMKVENVVAPGKIHGFNDFGRRVHVQSLKNVMVVVPVGTNYENN